MAETKNEQQPHSFKRKLGNTTYTVKVHFSKDTDKTFKDRVQKLIINEALKKIRNNPRQHLTALIRSRLVLRHSLLCGLRQRHVPATLSDERFTEQSADYEAEQKELKERAAVLQGGLSRTLEATANAEKFMKVVRKYTSFEELTPTLLREFVEKIVVHETEALNGKRRGKLRRQEIEIYYSFVGKVELPD